MGLSSTAKIVCDYKECGKTFLLPDPPEQPTEGAENTWSLVCGATGAKYYFCNLIHALAFGRDWIKSTPKKELQKELQPSAINADQLQKLRDAGIIVADSNAHKSMLELESIPTNGRTGEFDLQ